MWHLPNAHPADERNIFCSETANWRVLVCVVALDLFVRVRGRCFIYEFLPSSTEATTSSKQRRRKMAMAKPKAAGGGAAGGKTAGFDESAMACLEARIKAEMDSQIKCVVVAAERNVTGYSHVAHTPHSHTHPTTTYVQLWVRVGVAGWRAAHH